MIAAETTLLGLVEAAAAEVLEGKVREPGGPIVDAVTPLGFAWLLAPFAKHGPLVALAYARVLGASAWLAAAAWLGVEKVACR